MAYDSSIRSTGLPKRLPVQACAGPFDRSVCSVYAQRLRYLGRSYDTSRITKFNAAADAEIISLKWLAIASRRPLRPSSALVKRRGVIWWISNDKKVNLSIRFKLFVWAGTMIYVIEFHNVWWSKDLFTGGRSLLQFQFWWWEFTGMLWFFFTRLIVVPVTHLGIVWICVWCRMLRYMSCPESSIPVVKQFVVETVKFQQCFRFIRSVNEFPSLQGESNSLARLQILLAWN